MNEKRKMRGKEYYENGEKNMKKKYLNKQKIEIENNFLKVEN